ncbi:hypothetical protein Goari_005024, partial [Gossypium aridum]|nr:hypothetical protein [Gossypium aridum]
MACTMAMRLCLDLGLRRLVVEGDSFTVIKKVKLNEILQKSWLNKIVTGLRHRIENLWLVYEGEMVIESPDG